MENSESEQEFQRLEKLLKQEWGLAWRLLPEQQQRLLMIEKVAIQLKLDSMDNNIKWFKHQASSLLTMALSYNSD